MDFCGQNYFNVGQKNEPDEDDVYGFGFAQFVDLKGMKLEHIDTYGRCDEEVAVADVCGDWEVLGWGASTSPGEVSFKSAALVNAPKINKFKPPRGNGRDS